MNCTMLTLASGNTFFHSPETETSFQYAFVIDDSLNFMGGFLCTEADRKLEAFRNLPNVRIECVTDTVMSQFFGWAKFEQYADFLGTASSIFLNNREVMVSDTEDCNGTSSRAESCSERRHYYCAVGCRQIYGSSKKFPLWALIANHLSIFGATSFRYTFFKGYEQEPQKGVQVEVKSRYYERPFKAPAAYVRAFCSH